MSCESRRGASLACLYTTKLLPCLTIQPFVVYSPPRRIRSLLYNVRQLQHNIQIFVVMPQYTNPVQRIWDGDHWKLLDGSDWSNSESRYWRHCSQEDRFKKEDLKRHLRLRPAYVKGALDNLGYANKKRTTKVQLLELYRRAKRGLLSYEAVPTSDLKTFAQQRGLMPLTGTVSRSVLEDQLEEADENLVFTRSHDLPPELQLIIVEFYFASFPTAPIHENAKPPHIAHASSLGRELSLPLFYQVCRFSLTPSVTRLRGGQVPRFRTGATDFYAAFWQNATVTHFSSVSKLRLVIDNKSQAYWKEYYHLDLDLSVGGSVAIAASEDIMSGPGRAVTGGLELAKVVEELNVVAKSIAARTGVRKLQRGDLGLLCDAVDRAIPTPPS